jgi:hypothetical protein
VTYLLIASALITAAIYTFVLGWQRRPIKLVIVLFVVISVIGTWLILYQVQFDGFALIGAPLMIPTLFVYCFAIYGVGRLIRWGIEYARK